MQNGKLNNSQRKALVALVENVFKRRIEGQRELCSDAIARITNEVKAELGVSDIEEQLQVHEARYHVNGTFPYALLRTGLAPVSSASGSPLTG